MNVEANALLINAITRIVSCRESKVTTPDSGNSFGREPSKIKLFCCAIFLFLFHPGRVRGVFLFFAE